jgi:uncharacterized protein YraI
MRHMAWPRGGRRRAAGALIAAGMSIVLAGGGITTALAASGTVNTRDGSLRVRAGAGTQFRVIGAVANGSRVTIFCQRNGTVQRGTFGTSSLWDNIGNGGWVSDAFVFTGSNGRVAPAC